MPRTAGSKNKPKEEIISGPTAIELPEGMTMNQAVKEINKQIREERIRQYSNNRDHKGEGEPLCLNCGHRSDMHYIEHRWSEQRVGKNLQGDFLTVDVHHRKPNYDGARPCQHACLCKAYE